MYRKHLKIKLYNFMFGCIKWELWYHFVPFYSCKYKNFLILDIK